MPELNTKEKQIENLKYKLIDRYIILMLSILIIFAIIYTFFIDDKVMFWYLISGIVFISYSYILTRKKYPPNLIVNIYLTIAPLYNFYPLIAFWNNSVISICWLLPIPLGAYIFLSHKKVLFYTIYSLLLIVTGYIIANNFSFDVPKHNQKQVLFTDTIIFISNVLVIFLLIYYKDDIKKLESLSKIETVKTQENKILVSYTLAEDTDYENLEKLFERMEMVINQDMLFKNIKFNLSTLSAALNVNSNYISKAIRYKGYPNFNTYLNTYRINYVKKLFSEADVQKTTIMYIYTEAGFSSQSTFNRVFKQIEGVTPSKYLQNLYMVKNLQ